MRKIGPLELFARLRPPHDIATNARTLTIGTILNVAVFAVVTVFNIIAVREAFYSVSLPAVTALQAVAAFAAWRGRLRLSVFLSIVVGGVAAMVIMLWGVANSAFPIQAALALVAVSQIFLVVLGLVASYRTEVAVLSVAAVVATLFGFHILPRGVDIELIRLAAPGGWAVIVMAVAVANLMFSGRMRSNQIKETRKRFLASINHEIRNPLTSLLGHIQAVDLAAVAPAARSGISHVCGSAEHLRLLLETLLELHTMESGYGSPPVESCRVEHIVDSLRTNVDVLAAQLGISYEIESSCPAVSTVRTNRRAMVVALTAASVGLIRQLRELDAFHVLVRCDGGHVDFRLGKRVSVVSTELPPPDRSSPMVPPDQAGSAVMYVVAALLSQLGHSVRHRESGDTVLCSVRLPLDSAATPGVPEESVGAARPVASDEPLGRVQPVGPDNVLSSDGVMGPVPRPIILCVEDDASVRHLLDAMISTKTDWVFEPAVSGEEALEKASSEKPALILMDIGLPGMDGVETTHRLRHDLGLTATPVVAITAAVDRLASTPRDPELFQAVVTKPFDVDRLLETMRPLVKLWGRAEGGT